jgi:hypothetical protein
MKEQVSVYIDELSEVTLISKVELERLMRLDENVKKKMCDLRITILNLKDLEKDGITKWFRRKFLEKELKLLESLDK